MKKLKEILIPSVALFLICLISTFLLGGTNLLTKEKIVQVQKNAADEARKTVCSEAVTFEQYDSKTEGVEAYICYNDKKEIAGYAVTTTDKSYGGDIQVMTGFDAEGKITGVEILTIDDTPGLGMNAKKDEFRNQYIDKSGELTVEKNAKEANEIQAISGATITSKAVTRCVNSATEMMNAMKGGTN